MSETPRADGPLTHKTDESENYEDTLRVADSETAAPHPERLTTAEVRQGHTGDHVRYILGFSIAGVLVALFLIYLLFMR